MSSPFLAWKQESQVIISRCYLVISFTWWSKRKASITSPFFYESKCLWFPPYYLSQTECIFLNKLCKICGNEYPFYFSPLNVPDKSQKNPLKICPSTLNYFLISQHSSMNFDANWQSLYQTSWIGLITPSEHNFLYLPMISTFGRALHPLAPSRPYQKIALQNQVWWLVPKGHSRAKEKCECKRQFSRRN